MKSIHPYEKREKIEEEHICLPERISSYMWVRHDTGKLVSSYWEWENWSAGAGRAQLPSWSTTFPASEAFGALRGPVPWWSRFHRPAGAWRAQLLPLGTSLLAGWTSGALRGPVSRR